jgi:3-methyl-2-oxobutanoate hydroxymethyltransferase
VKFSANRIKNMKGKEKITAITAYDYPTAQAVDRTGVDIILVGDSLGMVVLGEKTTLPLTMEIMLHHLKAVRRGTEKALLVVDMPYGSYHISEQEAIKNAITFVKEGGAESVKIEGVTGKEKIIEKIIISDIPVMGHIGLTPQSINRFGGFKIQGKTKESGERLFKEAKKLEELGAYSIVLESIPEELAKDITENISIPTIGIGAGRFCDGQILVLHDLIGLNYDSPPSFVREYANVKGIIEKGVKNYSDDVKNGKFPAEKEVYKIKKGEK